MKLEYTVTRWTVYKELSLFKYMHNRFLPNEIPNLWPN